MATYTVVKGDCLWNIAKSQLGNALRWTEIADLNNISRSYPIIHTGDVLILPSGSGTTTSKNVSNMPIIQYFGLQAGSTRAMFAAWTFDRSNVAKFRVMWKYYANGIWFVGNDSETKDGTDDYKNSTYTAPDEASIVSLKVFPISETRDKTVNNKTVQTPYFIGSWSTEKKYDFSNNPPSKPSSSPTVTIKDYTLTAELDNLDLNATHMQFQIVKDDTTTFRTSGLYSIKINSVTNLGYVSYSCTVDAGGKYKVACRSYRAGMYSDWTTYTSNVNTKPAASSGISVCRANSETSIYLEWGSVSNATKYSIEYTTKKDYFDSSSETTTINDIEFTHYEVTGLESGSEYYFRVRATNDAGDSSWSEIASVVLGTTPTSPTTWSSTTTAITGESLTLYWVHNCEDESSMTYASLAITIDNLEEISYEIKRSQDSLTGEVTLEWVGGSAGTLSATETTNACTIDTSIYSEGTKLKWRVKTAGITKVYGDWSIQRTIDIYAPPTLSLSVTDSSDTSITQLTSFPFYVSALAGPNTQSPIGYHLVVTSNEAYQTVDNVGNDLMVSEGQEIYSKYFDISTSLMVELSAFNINLENNVNYTITCTVTMNSGLTAEASQTITVGWSEIEYTPNAEIGIDEGTYSAYLRPYCVDENNELITGITMSIYRREYDGSFTEIATGIANDKNTYVTDPHPALDYARYRIIAIDDATGSVNYYDMPGYPVQEKAIIIQWDEKWTSFEAVGTDPIVQPPWSGSLLRLPYNVDVSDNYNKDVSNIKYIGREHPVSYYGTHLGETSSWSTEIPKTDVETLYTIRRLAIWKGNVYVREPSGSGYWATISVSFSQKHLDLTIPVTFEITRVEGGM